MAELADAPDLGSGGRPCRFDSCYPHKDGTYSLYVLFFSPVIVNQIITVNTTEDFLTQI